MRVWQFWVINLLAFASVGLGLANIQAELSQQDERAEIGRRQQFINETVQIERVNSEVIKALARAAVSADDVDIAGLLGEVGVTYAVEESPEPAASSAASVPVKE
ncbi:MAG: hypothetical protein P1U54_10020 [Immundisolibacteraceae bacterium]|nr:hypothetical protein [Immundisolibacteraceae bacterium]